MYEDLRTILIFLSPTLIGYGNKNSPVAFECDEDAAIGILRNCTASQRLYLLGVVYVVS